MNCFLNSTNTSNNTSSKKIDSFYQFNNNENNSQFIDLSMQPQAQLNNRQGKPDSSLIFLGHDQQLQLQHHQPIYTKYLSHDDYENAATSGSQNSNCQNYHLNIQPNDLPIDVDSFVVNLPNLYEFDSIELTNNHQMQIIQSNHDLTGNQSNNCNQNQFTEPSYNDHDFSLIRLNSESNSDNFILNNDTNNFNLNKNEKTANEIQMSKVEILNQILLSASNSSASSTSSLSSSYLSSSTPSSYSSSSSSSLSIDQNQKDYLNTLEQSPHTSNSKKLGSGALKLKIKRKDEKICCNVCGHKSSGFHYGSYTCEACKLFFRRTEKQIRKTGFNECKGKNCQINYENRANCSECRYKKCIAVGMGMSRSRFGRHTQQLSSNYAPNISESLCALIDNLKSICAKQNVDLILLNNLIVDFYRKTIKLLTSNNHMEQEITSLEFNLQASSSILPDSPLSELSTLLTTTGSPHEAIKLPDCILIFFCVLFEIKINSTDLQLNKVINDFEQFVKFVEEKVLKKNKFVQILKIGIYFKCLRNILEKKLIRDDPYDKRITDLMRSELTSFKFNSDETGKFKSNVELGVLSSTINGYIFNCMSNEEKKFYFSN